MYNQSPLENRPVVYHVAQGNTAGGHPKRKCFTRRTHHNLDIIDPTTRCNTVGRATWYCSTDPTQEACVLLIDRTQMVRLSSGNMS